MRSFGYAGRGLRLAVRSHPNMRIHLALTVAVAAAAVWAGVSALEAAILVLCVVAVLGAELFNTAIEVLVDLQVGERYHVLAAHAKDLAAAAVFVAAIGAAAAGAFALGPSVLRALSAGWFDRPSAARLAALAVVWTMSVVLAGRPGPGRTAHHHSPRGSA